MKKGDVAYRTFASFHPKFSVTGIAIEKVRIDDPEVHQDVVGFTIIKSMLCKLSGVEALKVGDYDEAPTQTVYSTLRKAKRGAILRAFRHNIEGEQT